MHYKYFQDIIEWVDKNLRKVMEPRQSWVMQVGEENLTMKDIIPYVLKLSPICNA